MHGFPDRWHNAVHRRREESATIDSPDPSWEYFGRQVAMSAAGLEHDGPNFFTRNFSHDGNGDVINVYPGTIYGELHHAASFLRESEWPGHQRRPARGPGRLADFDDYIAYQP